MCGDMTMNILAVIITENGCNLDLYLYEGASFIVVKLAVLS